jgi:2-polyprenyl-6-methoxyphenol hydroxylase-like FAD-dependent oxidoreductase
MVEKTGLVEQSASLASTNVLISGASFAGLATAWWLNRLGCRVTVVEAARALRQGGTPVDVQGDTIGILARMGMIDAVRAHALPPRSMEFKNADDSTLGAFPAQPASEGEQYEIHRDDLLAILFAAVEGSVEILFGRSIRQLEEGPDDVAVTLDDSSRRTVALVIGCDGNRSNTRRLAFGGSDDFSYFMGHQGRARHRAAACQRYAGLQRTRPDGHVERL